MTTYEPHNQDIIRINDLSVTYPNGHTAINGITFSLAAGQICALVGVNGAGKSTLFKAMMGFVRPDKGSVTVMNEPVSRALKKNVIAYVPQSEDIDWDFPVLVRDVVMMGRYGHMGLMRRPKPQDHEAVDRALERVGLSDFSARQIGELSGGQKKRVFVARALAQNAKIIFLDEPFTGVDVKTESSLIDLLKTLAAEGVLIVVATHNLGSVPSFCDHVILINRSLVASGPVETTFTSDNLSRAFGGYLRHLHVGGGYLHSDGDTRQVTVITDDERPVVLYGEQGAQKIVPHDRQHDR